MTEINIASIGGDGIGPAVVDAALHVLRRAAELWDVRVNIESVEAGAARYVRTGAVYTESDFELCRSADAVLLGAIGLPDVKSPDGVEVVGDLMFRLRFGLDLYAGVRPLQRFHPVIGPLRRRERFGFTVIRENTEGLYASYGAGIVLRDDVAIDTLVMTADGIDRICRFAFEWAESHPALDRRRHVTCVDKSNVLRSYAFFRKRFAHIAEEYRGRVAVDYVYVDAFCAQLVLEPTSVHVVVAENMFGDIISDLAAAVVGSLGIAASGDIGVSHAVFQPAHGSAPAISRLGNANPIATILSVAMLADWLGSRRGSSQLAGIARDIESAVDAAMQNRDMRTPDIGGTATTQSCATGVSGALTGPEGDLSASV